MAAGGVRAYAHPERQRRLAPGFRVEQDASLEGEMRVRSRRQILGWLSGRPRVRPLQVSSDHARNARSSILAAVEQRTLRARSAEKY